MSRIGPILEYSFRAAIGYILVEAKNFLVVVGSTTSYDNGSRELYSWRSSESCGQCYEFRGRRVQVES
ncbi:hypothetical protein NPIL_697731 [Nephila pilipes]|uniref:Uncharacterized protein n=1 Tax=Nephila pilipes TaxID=299642 RepID=A0A8X6IY84_NEPPI|nr:hypothetical protein NPIL_697731 [Nephila pilipes]